MRVDESRMIFLNDTGEIIRDPLRERHKVSRTDPEHFDVVQGAQPGQDIFQAVIGVGQRVPSGNHDIPDFLVGFNISQAVFNLLIRC